MLYILCLLIGISSYALIRFHLYFRMKSRIMYMRYKKDPFSIPKRDRRLIEDIERVYGYSNKQMLRHLSAMYKAFSNTV